jgi:hypothetical protein
MTFDVGTNITRIIKLKTVYASIITPNICLDGRFVNFK